MIDLSKERLLTVTDVCERFRVSRITLRRWFKLGLEFVKLDRNIYTTNEALDRFVTRPPGEPSRNPGRVIDRKKLAEVIAGLKALGIK